jgi:hypothetical protein
VKTSARLLQTDFVGSRMRMLLVTLTYRPEVGWFPRQVTRFVKAARRWFADQGLKLRLVWVMELHKSGKPHYHAIVWLPRRRKLPEPDSAGWWPWGMTNVKPPKKLGGKIRSAAGYLAKYVSKDKGDLRRLPKGARMHGAAGLTDEARRERRWWLSPKYVREALGPLADIRIVRGGRMCATTGVFVPSPWVVEFDWGLVFIRRKEPC